MDKRKKKWNSDKVNEVRLMVQSLIPIVEIAKQFNVSVNSIRTICSKNKIKLKYKFKYTGMYEKVLNYYIKYGKLEAKKKFNLSEKAFTSIYETAIKKHPQRRDTIRRRDPWSTDELLFMLRCAGIINRSEINKYLKRGKNERVIKERLRLLNFGSSKKINGLSKKTVKEFFGIELEGIKTRTCPKGFEPMIISWVELNKKIKNIDPTTKKMLETMAMFQKFIHQCNDNDIKMNIHSTLRSIDD